MATYDYPGVYVIEQATPGPIAGVGTSVAVFLGDTEAGDPGIAAVTNWTEYRTKFLADTNGNITPKNMISLGVLGFFQNGGTKAYIGKTSTDKTIDALLADSESISDINLVSMPGATDPSDHKKVVVHCEKLGRFAILDAVNVADLSKVLTADEPTSSYAALYYPWLKVSAGSSSVDVPPSGHVAGLFARTDATKGVHKPPANELVLSAEDVSVSLSDSQQGDLNLKNVNVIRVFAGQGRPIVWGARTRAGAAETNYRYVNVRRLLLFLEQSLKEGLRWAVFEPHDEGLWKRVNRVVTEFLSRVWRDGALFGATAQEAFYVKVDSENNPPATRNLGELHVEVGVAPVRPAEFVVLKLGIVDSGTTLNG